MKSGNILESKEVIKRLGGNAKVAELCEVTPGAVSQWLHNGIPKAQLKFLQLARPAVFIRTEKAVNSAMDPTVGQKSQLTNHQD